ncbi:inactive protein RESTRICTED TEV MOVEMENT 1-like [Curcuma longa]|uniref:inactive protein RESTRICTED TEV MOVEMENT 1-like n=1 Tax=Curcuma longa TaxID=136217 RepID=UPI003D9DEC74
MSMVGECREEEGGAVSEEGEKQFTLINDDLFVKIGPRGHSIGKTFEEITLGDLKQIAICYDDDGINFIQMVYEQDGKLTLGGRHGGSVWVGDNFDSITLEQDEYLTSINGGYTQFERKKAIKSLKFTTNKKTYGPFGRKEALPFCFNFYFGSGSVCGFHGRSNGNYLVAIGVYINILSPRPQIKQVKP